MSLTKQDKQDIQEIVSTAVDIKVTRAVDDLDKKTNRRFDDLDKKTNRRFDDLDKKFDKRFDDLANIISEFATNVDQRFNAIESDVKLIKQDVSSILNRLDSIEKDISINEDERAVMGMQLTRLHDWVEKAAAKVGVEFVH